MTDEEWVALGDHEHDSDYYDDFERRFKLLLRPVASGALHEQRDDVKPSGRA